MTEKEIFDKHLRPLEVMGPKFVSVETGGHAIGFPDVFYSKGGRSGVIELKQSPKQRGEILIPYRPGQRAFLIEHGKRSLSVFVLFWYDGEFYLLKDFDDSFRNLEVLEGLSVWHGRNLDRTFLSYL